MVSTTIFCGQDSDLLPNLIQRECVSDILDDQDRWPMAKRVRLAKQKKVRDFFDRQQLQYVSYNRMIDHGVCGELRHP
jgi:hypothetical protein